MITRRHITAYLEQIGIHPSEWNELIKDFLAHRCFIDVEGHEDERYYFIKQHWKEFKQFVEENTEPVN